MGGVEKSTLAAFAGEELGAKRNTTVTTESHFREKRLFVLKTGTSRSGTRRAISDILLKSSRKHYCKTGVSELCLSFLENNDDYLVLRNSILVEENQGYLAENSICGVPVFYLINEDEHYLAKKQHFLTYSGLPNKR